MSYDIDVYMRASPHDIGTLWNQELTRSALPYQIPDTVLNEWNSRRQWGGEILVREQPPIVIEVYYDGRTPQKYAHIDEPFHEMSTAEKRLEACEYRVNFTFPSGGKQAEWEALWQCAAALAKVTDGVLVDPQSEGDAVQGTYTDEDIAGFVRQQIASFREEPQRETAADDVQPPTPFIVIMFSLTLFGLVFAFAFNVMGWSAEQDALRYGIAAGLFVLDILLTIPLILRYGRKKSS